MANFSTAKDKKLLYLLNDPIFYGKGVTKKIQSQLNALSNICRKVYFSHLSEDGKHRIVIDKILPSPKILTIVPYFQRYYFKSLLKFIIDHEVNILYVRYTHFSSPGFIKLLKKLDEKNIEIILEFPTFPYDDEYKTLPIKSNIKLLIDKCFRYRLKKYVKKAVTFTDASEIFGIPTLKISNAVSMARIDYACNHISENKKRESDEIKFIVVASMEHWHGYDRLLVGLSNYITNTDNVKIHIDLIGEGRELDKLKDLAYKLAINDNITFHGHKEGDSLNNLLLSADIGIDSLGRHRAGNNQNNSLKSKEYLAFGLPIIKSHIDPSIDNCSFYFNIPPDESYINLNDVMTWYNKNNFRDKKLMINEYAMNNFSWESQMDLILRTLCR